VGWRERLRPNLPFELLRKLAGGQAANPEQAKSNLATSLDSSGDATRNDKKKKPGFIGWSNNRPPV
jgi:hypothetical protein